LVSLSCYSLLTGGTHSVFEQAGFITPPAGGWDAKHFVNEAIVKLT
jgi:hypothetical protein